MAFFKPGFDSGTGLVIPISEEQLVPDSTDDARQAIPFGDFAINGIVFRVPPQAISISEQNINHKFETLRTRESTKVRSGHSRIGFTVSALFTSGNLQDSNNSINSDLMPILHSVKKLPLCFIENELVRASLPVSEDEVIGAFIQQVSVSTVPGMPFAWRVNFQFIWYNHRVFTPRLKFRREWLPKAKHQPLRQLRTRFRSLGRVEFVREFGSPGIAFNATAAHNFTEDISEARPLLEWLWPDRYESTNPANKDREDEEFRDELPAFKLKNFNEDITLRFTIMKHPDFIETVEGKKTTLVDIANKDPHFTGKRAPSTFEILKQFATLHQFGTTNVSFIHPLKNGRRPFRGGRFGKIRETGAHLGIDIAAAIGSPVYAAADGKIRRIQNKATWEALKDNASNKSAGIFVSMGHGKDFAEFVSGYMHLSKVSPEAVRAKADGSLVKQGTLIGFTGKTAIDRSVAHLHWQVSQGVKRINPEAILEGRIEGVKGDPRYNNDERDRVVQQQDKISQIIDPELALERLLEINGIETDKLTPEAIEKRAIEFAKQSDDPELEKKVGLFVKSKAEGWTTLVHAITGKVVQVTFIDLKIPGANTGDPNAIPTAITAAFGTNLAIVPLEGHRFPTIQYVGGQQTAVSISFRAEKQAGRDFISVLSDLDNAYNSSAIYFREFARQRGIWITNSMINSMNIKQVLIESKTTDTVPNSPESIAVSLQLIDNTQHDSMPAFLTPNTELSTSDLISRSLSLIFTKGWIISFVEFEKPIDLGKGRMETGDQFIIARFSVSRTAPESTRHVLTKLVKRLDRSIIGFNRISRVNFSEFTRNADASDFPTTSPIKLIGRHKTFILLILHGDLNNRGLLADSIPFQAFLETTLLGLAARLADKNNNKVAPADPDFQALFEKRTDEKFETFNQCYPDLDLPPNPITGLRVDTYPDFFLYNESDVRMCNSNTLKIIHGSGANDLPKARGFAKAVTALDTAAEGVIDIYNELWKGVNDINTRHPFKTMGGKETESNTGVNLKKGGAFVAGAVGIGVGIAALFTNSNIKKLPPDKTGFAGRLDIEGESTARPQLGNPDGNFKRANPRSKRKRTAKQILELHNGISEASAHQESRIEEQSTINNIVHSYNKESYTEILGDFVTSYSDEHYAIRRSFPTFKVFLVEEDGTNVFSSVALDDFYGVNAIKEISVVRHKDMAAEVCTIQILDLDGSFYNKKFRVKEDQKKLPDLTGANTESGDAVVENQLRDIDNPFYSTVIKEGTKIIVKLGYSNNPSELETIFIGQLVSIEGDHLLTLICQSYGTELVAQTFGNSSEKNVDFWNTTSSDLIHDLLNRSEVRHFGRWKLEDVTILGGLFGAEELRPDGQTKKVWTFTPSVIDDNIYLPSIDTYASGWAQFWGDIEYVYWQTTIWEVFKEMELRHPGYIAYPVPYGDDRMTIFFGNPNMPYLYRPAKGFAEERLQTSLDATNTFALRQILIDLGAGIIAKRGRDALDALNRAGAFGGGLSRAGAKRTQQLAFAEISDEQKLIIGGLQVREAYITGNYEALRGLIGDNNIVLAPALSEIMEKYKNLSDDPTKRQLDFNKEGIDSAQLNQAMTFISKDRIKTFRNYSLVTSLHDIIANRIRADHRGTFNSIELHYSDLGVTDDVNPATFHTESPDTYTVNADDNIKEHHIRRTQESWPNCSTSDLARRYASQLLANSLKRTYKGSLIVIGNAKIKPFDIVWLYDNYSDMAGPIEVEEVVHTFSRETGFVTEIVPNMIVTVKEEVTTLMVDAIGALFTDQVKDFTKSAALGFLPAGGALKLLRLAKAQLVLAAGAEATSTINTGLGIVGGGTIVSGGAVANSVVDPSDKAVVIGGALAGLAAATFPITFSVAGIVAGAAAYKFIRYSTAREPIIITPLIKEGKPYVTGLEGLESDGLLISVDAFDAFSNIAKKKWKHFAENTAEGLNIITRGFANLLEGYNR